MESDGSQIYCQRQNFCSCADKFPPLTHPPPPPPLYQVDLKDKWRNLKKRYPDLQALEEKRKEPEARTGAAPEVPAPPPVDVEEEVRESVRLRLVRDAEAKRAAPEAAEGEPEAKRRRSEEDSGTEGTAEVEQSDAETVVADEAEPDEVGARSATSSPAPTQPARGRGRRRAALVAELNFAPDPETDAVLEAAPTQVLEPEPLAAPSPVKKRRGRPPKRAAKQP